VSARRIHADLGPDAYRDLDELARRLGKTKTEVLRDAVVLEKWFRQAQLDGSKILVETKDGRIREVVPR
jgi:hypothetical protein